MRKTGESWPIVVVVAAVVSLGAAQDAPTRSITLTDLTVPADRQNAECALSPASSERDGRTVRLGLWAGLPIDTNPWRGTDSHAVAAIRERIDPVPIPDAPVISPRELARFRLLLAEDVEEAYAAVYRQARPTPIVVYAVRVADSDAARALALPGSASRSGPPLRLAIGPVAIVVSGDEGPCFDVVAGHVLSLAR